MTVYTHMHKPQSRALFAFNSYRQFLSSSAPCLRTELVALGDFIQGNEYMYPFSIGGTLYGYIPEITLGGNLGGSATTVVSSTTTAAKHSLYRNGSVKDSTSVYKENGATRLPVYVPYSYEITTTDGLFLDCPLKIELMHFAYDVSSTITVSFDICQPSGSSSLGTNDIWFDFMYSKSASLEVAMDSSRGTKTINGGGTTLTTSSATWVGLDSPVKQKMSVTTTVAGRLGVCSVWVYVNIPRRQIFLDPYPVIS